MRRRLLMVIGLCSFLFAAATGVAVATCIVDHFAVEYSGRLRTVLPLWIGEHRSMGLGVDAYSFGFYSNFWILSPIDVLSEEEYAKWGKGSRAYRYEQWHG